MIKHLLLALTSLTFKGPPESKESTTEFIKNTIRTEVLGIGFKLLFGVILVSAIIMSIIKLGGLSQVFFSQFQNGIIFEILSFGMVAVAGTITLYIVFNKGLTKVPISQSVSNAGASDLPALGLEFVEGFMKGLVSPVPAAKPESRSDF
jgi:hypothetical protein